MARGRTTLARDALPLAIFGLLVLGARSRPGPAPSPPHGGVVPVRLTLDELRELARAAGFVDVDTAAAIAYAESRGDPHAARIVTRPGPGFGKERSFGLWQINTLANPQFDEAKLFDPAYAAAAAFQVSQGGTNWSPWTTYRLPPTDPQSYWHWMPQGAP
jgi:hypothetical protein